MAILPYSNLIARSAPFNVASGNDVSCPDARWFRMYRRWELIDDLLAGTEQMQSKGTRWLPQEPREGRQQYLARLKRSVLYPALQDTVESHSAMPFSKKITVKGELTDKGLSVLEKNADDEGRGLTELFADAFTWLVSHGMVATLTDYSTQPDPDKPLTLAQEDEYGLRPIIKLIAPEDLIGVQWERGPNGAKKLKQIRYREWISESNGAYGTVEQCITWVWNANGTWEKWDSTARGASGGKSKKLLDGTHTYPGIPIEIAYAKRCGYMEAVPPLYKLAEMNRCHWESFSDQRHILRFARTPMFARTGISNKEAESDVEITPSNVFTSVKDGAKFYVVVHTGKAIEAGEKDLRQIEARMEVLGMAPLVEASGDKTATGSLLDVGKNQTAIQTWCRSLETLIFNSYKHAAKWRNVELPEDFGIDVFSDFGITVSNPAILEFLLKCRQSGELTRVTFLSETKRRGVLSQDVDPEEEATKAEQEAPDLVPAFPGLPPGGDPSKQPPVRDDAPKPPAPFPPKQ